MSSKKQTTQAAKPAATKEAPKKADAPKKVDAPKKADAPKEQPKKEAAPAPKKAETPKEHPATKKEESKPAQQASTSAPAAKKDDTKKATAPAAKKDAPAAKKDAPAAKKEGDKKAAAPTPAKKDDKKAKKAAPTPVNNSFLKPGKVVILLNGRQAGHKAVIVRSLRADKQRPFPTLLVAGIERYPLKVTRKMGVRKVARRSQVKPFLKIINVAHVMPTRYSMDVDLKSVADAAKTYGDVTKRLKAKASIRKVFQERYTSGKNRWFFQKLRF